MEKKEKKTNISISRTTLYTQKTKFCMQFFFSNNVCLSRKINLRLKKKHKNFWGQIKKYFRAIKKTLVIRFPYLEIV